MNLRDRATADLEAGENVNPRVLIWMRAEPNENQIYHYMGWVSRHWQEFRNATQLGDRTASPEDHAAFDTWLAQKRRCEFHEDRFAVTFTRTHLARRSESSQAFLCEACLEESRDFALEVGRYTCRCSHNVEDHVPDDFDPDRPCPLPGCFCSGFRPRTPASVPA